jgi:serine/threonine protein kinase
MSNDCRDDAEVDADLDRDPVEELAEEFLARRRQGEGVSIGEYAERHPHLAGRIRELFPALLLMEEMKPSSTSSHVLGSPLGAVRPGKLLERLGDFRILREIGRGGMGIVYEAEQQSLGRHVAVKVLPAACVASPTRLRRFLREAQAAARLHHTNIVPVFGVGEQDGIHYYVMQYIPGQGLDRVLGALSLGTGSSGASHERRLPALPPDSETAGQEEAASWAGTFSASQAAHMLLASPAATDSLTTDVGLCEPKEAAAAPASPPAGYRYWRSVARLGIQVADALEYAHRQGTLHRDIKPANLLLDNRGTVWIADFGLAKLGDLEDLTHSGDMVGTLRYMAPEQFEGKADARSDVYNLGLTLYELLTLRPAFDEKDRHRLIRQMTQQEPPRPRKLNAAIPLDLETIVVKAMACHPGHRYQTAGELAADLRCFLEDRPIRARRVTPAGRLWRWCRRNRAVAALSGTALALLLTVAVVASAGYVHVDRALARESEQRERAEAERTRTRAERERAETNLHLATKAFEDIFSKLAAVPAARPPQEDNGDEEEEDADDALPEPTWQTMVTDKDAALLESMLKFYDQFTEENQADVKLRRETARAYRRVGDIQRRLGQYDKAETAYRHALATYQAISTASPSPASAAAPGSAEHLTTIAAIHNELGVVYQDTGRWAEARQAHLLAQETLSKEPPAVAALAESRFELAKTYSYLSTAAGGRGPGRPGAGGGRNRSSGEEGDRSMFSDHAQVANRAEEPKNGPVPTRPVNGYGGRRGSRRSAGRDPEPAENNRKALEILAKLTAETPDNPSYRLAVARSQRDRYVLASFGGRQEEANQARQLATSILEELIAKAPENPDYRYELADTYAMPAPRPQKRGQNDLLNHSDPFSAEVNKEQLVRAVEIGKDLVARYPTVPQYRALLARCYDRCAEVSPAAPAEAEDDLLKAVALEKQLATEFKVVAAYRFFLARSLHQLAQVQVDRGELPKARASLEEAIVNAKQMPESSGEVRHQHAILAMQYGLLAKVLRDIGEASQADEAAAKARELGHHHGPPGFGPSRHEREKPAAKPGTEKE